MVNVKQSERIKIQKLPEQHKWKNGEHSPASVVTGIYRYYEFIQTDMGILSRLLLLVKLSKMSPSTC